jgi:hypothetical protein
MNKLIRRLFELLSSLHIGFPFNLTLYDATLNTDSIRTHGSLWITGSVINSTGPIDLTGNKNITMHNVTSHLTTASGAGIHFNTTGVAGWNATSGSFPAQLDDFNEAAKPDPTPTPDRPTHPDHAIGWRAWKTTINHDGIRLTSLFKDNVWPPRQPLTAPPCDHPHHQRHHDQLDPDCGCGIWSLKTLAALIAYINIGDQARTTHVHIAYGRVAQWGHTLTFTHGHRSRHAYPIEILTTSQWLATILADTYKVPAKAVTEQELEQLAFAELEIDQEKGDTFWS